MVGSNLLERINLRNSWMCTMLFAYSFQVALDITDIPTSGASWILCRLVDHIFVQSIFIEHAFLYELETDNFRSFLKNIHRGWGHRSGQNATDVGVMAARCGKKNYFFGLWIKNGTDDGDVGEMSTANELVINRLRRKSKELAILPLEVNWSSKHPLP
jgi:hypothetical protein